MVTGKSLTVKLTPTKQLFKEWEIVRSNNHPIYGEKSWSIITHVKDSGSDYTLSMRKLNVSKWKLIRSIQLKVIKNLFKDN